MKESIDKILLPLASYLCCGSGLKDTIPRMRIILEFKEALLYISLHGNVVILSSSTKEVVGAKPCKQIVLPYLVAVLGEQLG